MAPCQAMVQIIPGVVLPIRIFVNRKQIAKNIQESQSSFETPLLSNNSIIRLRSPLVRLYLSNADSRSLCQEIRHDLTLILFELTAREVHEEVVGKLKIGNLVKFEEVFERVPALKSTIGLDIKSCHLQTLERVAKYQYKLRYDHNWGLDIFITDIRKLTRIRNTLLLRLLSSHSWSERSTDLPQVGISGMNFLRRIREEVVQGEPEVLQELDDDEFLLSSETPVAPIMSGPEKSSSQEKKPQFKFAHQQLQSLGNCIEIHVLRRPKRVRSTET
ncbi:LADA_0F07426g1_1 [Lachancea dasiensis]|uniref:LADA_0F07426g1_1 n=1 Tax=Lachancea dasiensis TaxID=1072105 RepID=A0A1G4JKB0_9SACH|nr:LADA_0F07426g1_1 [Lachancea dasiensis]